MATKSRAEEATLNNVTLVHTCAHTHMKACTRSLYASAAGLDCLRVCLCMRNQEAKVSDLERKLKEQSSAEIGALNGVNQSVVTNTPTRARAHTHTSEPIERFVALTIIPF